VHHAVLVRMLQGIRDLHGNAHSGRELKPALAPKAVPKAASRRSMRNRAAVLAADAADEAPATATCEASGVGPSATPEQQERGVVVDLSSFKPNDRTLHIAVLASLGVTVGEHATGHRRAAARSACTRGGR